MSVLQHNGRKLFCIVGIIRQISLALITIICALSAIHAHKRFKVALNSFLFLAALVFRSAGEIKFSV